MNAVKVSDSIIVSGRGRLALAASAASLALLCAAPAEAQGTDAPAKPTAAASDQDTGEILVTARRRTERLIDVPVAATAIGVNEIRQYAITNLANIKFAAPQISFDRGGTGTSASISLRGVSSSSLDAGLEQSILVDYDGMPTSRGRIVSDGLFDVETIDVLKGPQALFFGKNSPGGVVSIKSVDPGPRLEGYLRAGYEFTAAQKTVQGAISVPVTDKFGVRFAIFGSTSDGYIHNDDTAGIVDPFRTARLPTYTGGTVDQGGKSLYGAEDKIAGRFTAKYEDGDFDATFKLMVSHFTSDGVQSLAEIMACPAGRTKPVTAGVVDPNGDCRLNNHIALGLPPQAVLNSWPTVARYNDGKPWTQNDTILPTLTLNKKIDNVTLTSITSILRYEFINQGNADKTSYSYFYSNNNENNTSFVQEVRAVTSFAGMLNFAAGGYYANDRRTFTNGTVNIAPADPATGQLNTFQLLANNRGHAFSAFAQVTFKPVSWVELAGGARYTDETKEVTLQNTFVNPAVAASYLAVGKIISGKRTEDNVSPEFTATFHPTRDLMLYAAYKTGYLSGGYSNPGNLSPTITIAKDTYGEEKADGFEGGAKFTLLDHALTGSLIGYHYNYKGLQLSSTDLTANPPIIRTQNAGDSISQGVELEMNYRAAKGLTLRGTANYNDAHFENFTGAQCYALQTAALGCIANSQDLSGRPIYRAPAWIMTAGGAYEFDVGGGYRLQLNADARYTSKYYVSLSLNPLSLQKSYTIFNAGARLTLPDDKWSLAVIGRNLTNRLYGTIGNDKTSGVGEVTTTVGEPRVVELQIERRF